MEYLADIVYLQREALRRAVEGDLEFARKYLEQKPRIYLEQYGPCLPNWFVKRLASALTLDTHIPFFFYKTVVEDWNSLFEVCTLPMECEEKRLKNASFVLKLDNHINSRYTLMSFRKGTDAFWTMVFEECTYPYRRVITW